jgi:capsular exopolysaccharide synthesis family protein
VVKESIYESVASGNYDSFFEVVSDPLVEKLKGEYNDLMIQYSDLSSFYKSEYPPLKKLQARIEGVRQRLNSEIKTKVKAIETNYKTAAHKEKLLKTRVDEQEKLAMALNQKTVQYKKLEREVKTNQSIYDSLLQRLKETDVTEGIKSNGIQVVDHASIPLLPFKPNIPRNLILAFVVGLIGAVGIAFLREFFDRTIKTPDEIREKMRLPVLGTIYKLKNSNSSNTLGVNSELLYLAEPISPFSESIRSIRTSVLLSSPNNHLRSLLITSSWPGEGKTTLACNLAISFASGGKDVLLIDGDFRHPSLGRKFGIKNGKCGIGNYLLSKCELNDAVHPTDIPNLAILPGGSERPCDVSELVHSHRLEGLMEYLSEKFEYIIFDSSPSLGFSDSLMLAKVVDGTIIVASTGLTMQKDLTNIVKRLYDIDARFLGFVINRVEEGRDSYYDHYNHYYKNLTQ